MTVLVGESVPELTRELGAAARERDRLREEIRELKDGVSSPTARRARTARGQRSDADAPQHRPRARLRAHRTRSAAAPSAQRQADLP